MLNIVRDPQPIVEVHVFSRPGKSKVFKVHKNFVCYHSPFFDAAFNGNFVEGDTQQMKLEDTCPEAFGIFVNWLYTQDIENNKGELPSCENLMNLWLLADLVLVPRLQNETIDKLDEARRLRGRLPSMLLARVYEHTTKGCPLRTYIIRTWPRKKIMLDEDRYPRGLLVDLVNSADYRTNFTNGDFMVAKWTSKVIQMSAFHVDTAVKSITRDQRVAGPVQSSRAASKASKRKFDEMVQTQALLETEGVS